MDSTDDPVDFTGSASYISGNELLGTPSGPSSYTHFGVPSSVAVDSSGDILVADAGHGQFGAEEGRDVVDEFAPSGLFVREITGPPSEQFGNVTAVATDPTTGNILAVDRGNGGEGDHEVIDEFNSSGTYLARITGAETPAGFFGGSYGEPGGIAVSKSGYLYVPDVLNQSSTSLAPPSCCPR